MPLPSPDVLRVMPAEIAAGVGTWRTEARRISTLELIARQDDAVPPVAQGRTMRALLDADDALRSTAESLCGRLQEMSVVLAGLAAAVTDTDDTSASRLRIER
ncbi:hypothetical protein [Gordonia aquimaris]|uniref:Uncharacterized protein n=1 Tax=Gordonia aquimaris TaxID=2984863 RepID=A0A9X3I437_9ACTN|nr:hypothetical protein [Gordonia aquimaris]MCX2963059.1 hypothetical protein [Gordonia aquimaris]